MNVYAIKYEREKVEQTELSKACSTLEEAIEVTKSIEAEYDRVMIINDASMSDELYLAALKRMSEHIETGLPLVLWNSRIVGTHCSWGLCNNDPKQWPNPLYHVWPMDYLNKSRVTPVRQKSYHFCVFDSQECAPGTLDASKGCFWRCTIFQEHFRPSTNNAILLYERMIDQFQGDEK
jgi:hypothetical protein